MRVTQTSENNQQAARLLPDFPIQFIHFLRPPLGHISMSTRRFAPHLRLLNLDQQQNLIEFELQNSGTAFANALRRVMIAEVPTFAFEFCEFKLNTSPLPDEFIAHRIALCPLVSEVAHRFNTPEECDCQGGCPKCQITYVINVHADPDRTEPRTVTTNDLEMCPLVDPEDEEPYREWLDLWQQVKPVKPFAGDKQEPITIAVLGAGQKLQVLCHAQKCIGREHAKWSPCCCSAYRMPARITLDEAFFRARPPEWKRNFVKTCPNKVFKYNQQSDMVDVDKSDECTFCRQCQESLEEEKADDKVVISPVEDTFIFRVEGTGALKPDTIVLQALEILAKKLSNVLVDISRADVPGAAGEGLPGGL